MSSYTAVMSDKNSNTVFPQTIKAAIIDDHDTPWGEWTSDGVVLLNGANPFDSSNDSPKYRKRVVQGNTQIQMIFVLKNLGAGNTNYVGIPGSLLPKVPTTMAILQPASGGQTATWLFDSGQSQLKLYQKTDGIYNPSGGWFPFFGQWEV
ncbi:hypothetical protein [Leuconostoc mesenteroides]|uniref:hypothetical protein n=1 Tax=Leuconostoc mesenteroides TaxID=1245 RepID=UPI00236175B1|nr:hypothetical protein [Leuconostoc mesenteroides]